jgi:hypothetical protein
MPFPFALHRLADGLALHALAIALAIPLVNCARIDFNAAHKKDSNQQRLIVGCFTVLVVRVTLIVLVPALAIALHGLQKKMIESSVSVEKWLPQRHMSQGGYVHTSPIGHSIINAH